MSVIFFLILVLASPDISFAQQDVMVLASRADPACVNFQAIGICRRNTPPFAGIKVRYWQPVLLVETLKQSAASSSDGTNLQMNEAHVYGCPFSNEVSLAIEAPCEGPPDLAAPVSYLSEQDKDEWRRGLHETAGPMGIVAQRSAGLCERFGRLLPALCMGVWGPIYPRTGFAVHGSEVVASAISAFRAVDAASFKPQPPRRVIAPVLFWPSVRSDRLQMVSPVRGRCMAIGEDPRYWDRGKRSRDGRYVWIYWRKKECCLF